MRFPHSSLAFAMACVLALCASDAYACIKCDRGASKGRGCGQLVTVKHPDLKGPARKAEWDKCMADPDNYFK